MRVAVLGLGRMGHAVALRLQQGGHAVTVWNRTGGRADELVAAGAAEADSPAMAAATAAVVISCLANDDAVRELALGTDGVLANIGSGVYADASTISPKLSTELADRAPHFVALPILGAPQAVAAGTATYLAGGDAEAVDRLRPLLESLGGTVKRYDRPEKASTAKLAVNLLLLSGLATLAESLTVARAGGLSDEQLSELLRDSPMVAPGLLNRFDALVTGSGPTWWTTVLAAKDARLAIATALAGGHELRLAPAVRDVYEAAIEHGFDDRDIIAVADLYR